MPKIIKNRQVQDDAWQVLAAEAEVPAHGPVLVALSCWQNQQAQLAQRQDPVGVWLDAGEEAKVLAPDLAKLPVIGLNFPSFADGRAYSNARILREELHYQGEIRALGDVLRDQMFYMQRCGFDAFAVRADKDIHAAVASLSDFSEVYQAGVDQPLPLFQRRS